MTSPNRLSRVRQQGRCRAVRVAEQELYVDVIGSSGDLSGAVPVVTIEQVVARWDDVDWWHFHRLMSTTPAARDTPRQE